MGRREARVGGVRLDLVGGGQPQRLVADAERALVEKDLGGAPLGRRLVDEPGAEHSGVGLRVGHEEGDDRPARRHGEDAGDVVRLDHQVAAGEEVFGGTADGGALPLGVRDQQQGAAHAVHEREAPVVAEVADVGFHRLDVDCLYSLYGLFLHGLPQAVQHLRGRVHAHDGAGPAGQRQGDPAGADAEFERRAAAGGQQGGQRVGDLIGRRARREEPVVEVGELPSVVGGLLRHGAGHTRSPSRVAPWPSYGTKGETKEYCGSSEWSCPL